MGVCVARSIIVYTTKYTNNVNKLQLNFIIDDCIATV